MMPFPVVEEAALPDSPAPTGPADAEPESAVSSHVRLQLERVDGLIVIGWAVSTGGQAAQIQLLVNGEVAEAAVSTVPRQDVADALGLTESKDVGFRLSLPPGIWGADSGERRSVELRAGGVQVAVPLPQTFNELVRQLRDSEDSGLVAEQLIALQLHARALPRRVLAPDAAAWLQQQELERAAADARREMALEEGPRPRGQVERVEAAVVQGWCWLSDSSEEAVTLHTSEGLLDCSVIRVERNDVQAALQSERRRLGFEIEIPATVWQSAADEQSVCLMVRVDGRLLQAEPVVLSRVQIPSWLEQVRQAELQADTLVATAARQEWQYRCLLLIEHVVAAGMLHSLDLPLQAFVRANAERFGLSTLLQGEASASFAGDRVLAEPKGPDFGTLTNWRLMRAFNQALVATGDQPMTALDQVLAAHQPGAQVTERFLWAVLPFFCSRGLYAALRLRLDGAHLRALASSSSAFDLSLLLPEAACSGDLHLAQMAMKKLSQATEGWLNTECIHEAVRTVMQTSDPRRLQQGDAVDFLNAFFAFVEHLGDQGYWSRLHDSHVVGALVSVLKLQSALSVGAAKWAVDILWRRFGLVPDFWRRLDTVEPPLGGWGARTEDARQDFRAVESMLSNRSDEGGRRAGLEALERFRVAGNPDAQIIARELAMSSRETSRSALFSLLTQSPADLIRLAAHPLANRLVPVHRAGLAEAIRALSGIPQVPRRAAVAAFVDACLATGAAAPRTGPVRSEALLPVSLRENHYLGVRLLCAAWLREHGESPASGKSDSWLVDLREQWFGAFDDCADLPHPPATLSATVSLLGAAPVAAGGSAQQVVAEMRRAMKARYGPVAALAEAGACEQPRLAAGIGGHSTLVAIYSCVRNLPTRVQAIRDTWARDLTARGIPWVVVVGDGDGQLRGDVLHLDAPDDYESLPAKTLALVDWVYRHTRFEHLVKIDDDCHLAVDAYFDEAPFLAHHYHGRLLHRAIGATDRIWHQAKSRGARAAAAADKTPEPSTYADGSSAYVLSRYAMAQVALALDSTVGARLTRSAFLEDKLLGDLLATRGLAVSNEGHYTLIRRRFGPAALPVNAWDNLFYPSQASPTLVTHLDDHLPMVSVQAGMGDAALRPPRLWPTDRPVQISGHQTNQLELLSDPARLALLDAARFLVVAVARNEKVLLPHFLAHYRRLGATAFVLVDNLSDDGTREYLHAQPDVILYSADTEYKESHYGVSWQQAVLAAHAVGRWVVLADIDEFLVYPGCEQRLLADWLTTLEAEGHDAARVLMVDMYPAGPLHEADFEQHDPFALATCYDREPLLSWRLGSGSFSNSPTWLSALRHRLIPDSAPNIYTSQKLAVVKYQPWIRFAEGLHYASNLIVAPDPVWFAHFKYHAGFQRKVQTEVARKQHFNGAEEYRKYAGMLAEARDSLAEPGVTATYAGSRSWAR
jgi:hypothetical protein